MNVHMVTAGLKKDKEQPSSIKLNLSELRLGIFFLSIPLPVPIKQIAMILNLIHNFLMIMDGPVWFNDSPMMLSVSALSRSSVELMMLMILTVAKANGIL